MALIELYRFTPISGGVYYFIEADDMADAMLDENELEYYSNQTNPVQFDIEKDIASIKLLSVGGKFRHTLGTVELIKMDEDKFNETDMG